MRLAVRPKWIPGMHLRVREEAEMIGFDLDQFFDEQIGDPNLGRGPEFRMI